MIPLLNKMKIDVQQKTLKKYKRIVAEINEREAAISRLTDEELRNKTIQFKEQMKEGSRLEDLIPEAFAVVREASKRVLGLRHYDVQLMGGLALFEGNIAEMATGEGKTLVASLPSYLRALEGKGVHVITVNDYLAKRDHDLIGQVHEFLGLSVGLNIPEMTPEDKKKAYMADITYGVGNEFGFDYLRDNIAQSKDQRVQRPLYYAILDEIDSVLIDEAKTPLILAGKSTVSKDLFYITAQIVKGMENEKHFTYDPETKAVSLTDEGITLVEEAFGIENLYDIEHQTLYHYLIQSLRAEVMFKRDVDYIVRDGAVHLVDAFTGRIMDGRSLSNGLHQAIEAKEGLKLTDENKTQASITIQNYFRRYPILSGMTGTAKTEEKEFQTIYGMDVIQIPTNRPVIRQDLPDQVYLTVKQKYKAVTEEVKRRHEKGQPVLIGTTSIQQSEILAEYLDQAHLPYQLLNAKSVEQESQMIALAGQKGQITISTNMAGRGTDILLGEGVAELGGLHVIGTERHESRRIDNQLKGRAGRQGDPGSSQFFLSLEDELVKRFAEDDLEKKRQSIKTDEKGKILNTWIHDFFDKTQKICEGSNFSIREYTLKLDNVVSEQRNVIYEVRDNILFKDNMLEIVYPMVENEAKRVIEAHCPEHVIPENWDLDALQKELNRVIAHFGSINEKMLDVSDIQDLVSDRLHEYKTRLEMKAEDESFQQFLKFILLTTIDDQWMNHLEKMEELKEGIGLRGYGQMDPIIMYEKEGFDVFKETFETIEKMIAIQLTKYVETNWGLDEGENRDEK